MFDVGPAEIAVLAVLAVIIFGPERLPELARKAARVVRFLRGIANNAQESLSRELGTEVDLSNPKAFIKSYLLDDIQPVLDDVKKDLQEVESEVRAEFAQVRNNIEALDQARPVAAAGAARAGAPFDTEAT
ncbi:Sec-independent protein translocase subunit TatB [Granulicoccus sp. GXG6511]|uniref:Sec-independent protein translocase subunit TatB n=1 Tax=Granulicoccus sp. GXG6511 TaxID=3381351 RepID=UPI003D7CE0F4